MEQFIAFTLWGSGLWFAAVVVAFLVAVFASEVNENGFYAAASLIMVLGVNHFWGNFPIMEYISVYKICIYLGIGFAFSFVRTYFKGRHLKGLYQEYLDRFESTNSSPEPQSRLEFSRDRFDLKGHVFRWWLMFPVSMTTWFFGSLLRDIGNAVYAKLGGLYEKVLNL